ncbi:uncharacterized protein LOC132196976 [Neocloeon triangulifer]|uniref:uncharacterized protein LOC132196976 n=1 Tax=Neocloeon triangulifer TaxID=2078957 RepID=UPI00286F3534|nr:uncharacterized protein LOC132196976 [Neocloeon triangulifer]
MPLGQPNVDKIAKACSSINLTKAAKYHMKPLNGLDILVCGNCLEVFHLLVDIQKHKQRGNCVPPETDPSKFNPTADVWAFMLWKNSPECKKMKFRNAGENSVLWKKWQELPGSIKEAWKIAGNILFDMNWIHKSKDEGPSADHFEELFTQQLGSAAETDPLANVSTENPLLAVERIQTSRRGRKKQLESINSPPESISRTPQKVVNKKIDKKSKSLVYLVNWVGLPEAQSSWESEESLEGYKHLIQQFEENLASPSRPCRSSKQKALNKVKEWTLKKTDAQIDEEFLKAELGEEDEEDSGDASDDEFRPDDVGGSPEGGSTSSSSEEIGDESDSLEEKPRVFGKKRKSSMKPSFLKKQRKVLQQGTPSDDRILHVSNCYRSIRVNANALTKVKPGIHEIKESSSLLLLAPMLCKNKPKEEQPGLVIITNNILRNRPGIRKRQGLKLFEDAPQKHFCQELPEKTEIKLKPKPVTSVIKILSAKTSPAPISKVFVPAKINVGKTPNKIHSTILPHVSAESPVLTKSPLPKLLQKKIAPTPTAQPSQQPSQTPKVVRKAVQKRPRVLIASELPKGSKTPTDVKKLPKKQPISSAELAQHKSDQSSGPQHVEIPKGVDPGALEVPAGMQLMVSDNGEYYLLPQQPEGSTVALAHDPESGAVQVVAIPEQATSVNIQASHENTAIAPQGTVEVPINSTEQGKFLIVMTKEGEFVLVQTDQNTAEDSGNSDKLVCL